MMVPRKQRGITALGLLLILMIFGFFVLLVIRLVPVYLEHMSVASSIKSLEQEVGIADKSPQEVRTLLTRRLEINSVDNFKYDLIKIKNEKGKLLVSLDYEVRVPILANVDAIVSFSEHTELGRH